VAKRWNRVEIAVGLVVLGIGAILLGVAGLFIYMSATATPLHPDPQQLSSVADGAVSPQASVAIERARQAMRASVAEQNLPGLSVAVAVDGKLVWAEGFGWADIDNKTPVTPDTRFRIGTLSTVLTSAAAGLLIEKQVLQLDDPIQAHVPEFPATTLPVTLGHLMAHTAGVRNDSGDEGELFGQSCQAPADGVRLVADDELRFEPGSRYQFSNYSWIMVSAAIEAAAGEPFLMFMQKQIFEPLRMDDTMADASGDAIQDLATPYFPKFAADPRYGPDPMREINLSCYAGASVFVSTPSDLVRFATAINSGKLLKPDTVRLLQSSQRLTSGEETGYGLGWDLETVTVAGKPTPWIGHDGDLLGGVAATLATLPEHGLVIALVSNTSYSDTPALALKIAEALVGGR
jgi:CubicO group peptidase (beta-lactamase class C family)